MPAKRSAERMHILHTPVRRDAPALDRVYVVHHARRFERAALGDQLLMSGLRRAGLVGRAALTNNRDLVPDPREAEAGLADRQHWILQRGEAPGLAAVSRYLDARDLAPAGPGQPGDRLEVGPRPLHVAR